MKKTSKVYLSWLVLLATVLVAGLMVLASACGDDDDDDDGGAATSAPADTGDEPTDEPTGEPIKIGVVTPRSGPVKTVGDAILNGLEIARDILGPINGRPVEFVVEDTLVFSGDEAVAKAQKLVEQDGVVAITGPSTGETLGLAGALDRIGVPVVATNSGHDDPIGALCNNYLFVLSSSGSQWGRVVRVAMENNRPELLAAPWYVLGNDYGWSEAIGGAASDVVEADVVGVDYSDGANTDWATYFAKAEAESPGLVLAPVTFGDSLSSLLAQWPDSALKDTPLLLPNAAPDWILSTTGSDVLSQLTVLSGLSWATWTHEDQNPILQEFNETYYETLNETPEMQAIMSATGYYFLWNAIKQSLDDTGGTTPDDIVAAMETLDIETPLYSEPLHVIEGTRYINAPQFITHVGVLDEEKYGTDVAWVVDDIITEDQYVQDSDFAACEDSRITG